MPHPQDKAIAHVAALAAGGPADPSWRVTLHFHPDRLVTGVPILEVMARDGYTGRSSKRAPATGV
jgi:hypothetical protein